MSENDAIEQIRLSWKDVEPTLVLKRASALSGIGHRELRRLIEEGLLLASQNRPGVKGSTLRISKEALIRYLAETVR
jgi:hypothetical protein